MKFYYFLLIMVLYSPGIIAQDHTVIHLWPEQVPGESEAKHPPRVTDNKSGDVTRITDITDPALIAYPAPSDNNNGSGIIICPGGGYSILAIDKEGHEIAEWLNSLGFSAFVLQYRVPGKQEGALMDIQRALRIVRSRASEWKLNPGKTGVLGFSAGGSLCARAATRYPFESYKAIDKIDSMSCRPNFTLLLYPAYLDRGENKTLTPELIVDANTPPVFIFGTADDAHGNSALVFTAALRDAKVPVELHLLPQGGHGYGIRPGNIAAETWPKLAENWLKSVIRD